MEVSGKKASKDKNVGTAVTDTLCEPCQDIHVTTSANGICRECKEYMCNTCFQHHLKARQCRNHVLVNAGNSSASTDREEDFEKCKHHGKEAVKYYCRKHDVVGCGDCMISGHGACKPEFIKDISEDFKENDEFKNLVRKLEKMTSAIVDSEKKIQDDKRKVKSMHELAVKELREFRTDINEYLDKAEDELNHLKSKNESLLTKLDKDCKLLSTNLAGVKKETNAEIYHGSSLFIHSVECKPKVLDTENAINQLQLESNIEKITFVPDKRLLSISAPKLNLKRTGFEVPAFVRTKPDFQERSDSMRDQKSRNDKVTEKKKEIKSKAKSTGARTTHLPVNKTDDDIVFETFYHRSGKEFQCIYQSGMRFYLDDLGSKEWMPFPKRWYNEGLLVTNTKLKNENAKQNINEQATGGSGQGVEGTSGGDDREGFLMHPSKGRIPTYMFYKKHNVHMYFDRDIGSWVRMPIGWELHHSMVKSLVDQIDEAVPTWGDRHDMLALLRACNYDPDECISIYLHLKKDEWMKDAQASGKSKEDKTSGARKDN
ncbi:uncharacterized protein LOC128546578 [Mercenaria mercenaria]|uniref:uncharacterized protein LOC128546578 n=1 Tax=Mercenaria mercenaria TaxID=6596 RepID=UPI00234ECF05|nr:uncharacterized protein LOC128546578 [Mercenaria mercenaria]